MKLIIPSTESLIEHLNEWVEATTAYSDDPLPNNQRLIDSSHELIGDLRNYTPYGHDEHHHGWQISELVLGVSARFIFGHYTDSDTDAPADVEYDVHNHAAAVDPLYQVPEDITPAYVIGTVYDTPEE